MIGATLVTHNCLAFDYCLAASMDSVLGVADELVVVECESTDGTKEYLLERAQVDPRIRVIERPWRPSARGKWLADLSNEARQALQSPYHFYLQADEVLHESGYDSLRHLAKGNVCCEVPRLNFWRDSWHMAPHGKICGHSVVRCGPKNVPIVGDAESMDPRSAAGRKTSGVRIFHYGCIRRANAFFAKSKEMQHAFFGEYDERLQKAERENLNWPDQILSPSELLVFGGSHPKAAKQWLAERGHPSWAITDRRGEFQDATQICHAFAAEASSVLDLGCGQAHHTRGLRGITFVDIDPGVKSPPGTINANLIEFAERFDGVVDVVIMLDVIEHLTKEAGTALLNRLEKIAKRIVMFTPVGELWVGNGKTPHDHYCGWTPQEFSNLGYNCWEWPQFHHFNDDTKHGAFWAWKDVGKDTVSVETISRKSGVRI